jgi:hypothetical protein
MPTPKTATAPAKPRKPTTAAKPAAKPAAVPVVKPAAKVDAKPATQPVDKSVAKPAARPAANPAPKPPAPLTLKPTTTAAAAKAGALPKLGQPIQGIHAAKAIKPAKPPKALKAAKPLKAPKLRQKPVRDSFTMPEAEFALVATLKARAMSGARETKKSELLRAGLHALAALDTPSLLEALNQLDPVKIGRPKKGH